jgi:hypothetical protein
MAQAGDLNTTNPRGWSLTQLLVWIVLRREKSPHEAEQIAHSPEIAAKIEEAFNELVGELWKTVLRLPEGVPIDKFRIRCGHRWVDFVTLIQIPPSSPPGALSVIMHELRELIGKPGGEFYPIWAKRTWLGRAAAPTTDAETPSPALERARAAIANNPGKSNRLIAKEIGVAEPPQESPPPATRPVESAVADPAPGTSVESPAALPAANTGGRPTDRDLVIKEANLWLTYPRTVDPEGTRRPPLPSTFEAFAGALHKWLESHAEHRGVKTGKVLGLRSIKDHVRPLWNGRKQKTVQKPQ